MPSVRCPSCDTAQHVEAGSSGYACSSCGKEWGFVVCRSCGSRFHCEAEGDHLDLSSVRPAPGCLGGTAAPGPGGAGDTGADHDHRCRSSTRHRSRRARRSRRDSGSGPTTRGPRTRSRCRCASQVVVRSGSTRSPRSWPSWCSCCSSTWSSAVTTAEGDGAPTDGGGQVSGEEATATMCGHVQQVAGLPRRRARGRGRAAPGGRRRPQGGGGATDREAGQGADRRDRRCARGAREPGGHHRAVRGPGGSDRRPPLLTAAESASLSTPWGRVLRMIGAMADRERPELGPRKSAVLRAPSSSSTCAMASR